jgi:hypothetical protein
MRILSAASVKGTGAVNEDIAGAAGPLAWVFDGATATGQPAIPDAGSDAQWLVRRLDGTIRRMIGRFGDEPLADLARRLIEDVRQGLDDLGLEPDRLTPYASGALLRATPGHVDYLVLGDVTVTVTAGGRYEAHTDPDAARLARVALDLATRYSGEELRCHQQEFERTYVNRPDGYWVFGTVPEAAAHGVSGRFRLDAPGLALLATDGFARVVEVFDLAPSWPALLDALAAGGADSVRSVIGRLRELEADPAHTGVDLMKSSDDATAMLLRLGGSG